MRVLSEGTGEYLESESSSDWSGNTALVDRRYRSDEAGEEVVAGLPVVGLHQSWLRKLAALPRP